MISCVTDDLQEISCVEVHENSIKMSANRKNVAQSVHSSTPLVMVTLLIQKHLEGND